MNVEVVCTDRHFTLHTLPSSCLNVAGSSKTTKSWKYSPFFLNYTSNIYGILNQTVTLPSVENI